MTPKTLKPKKQARVVDKVPAKAASPRRFPGAEELDDLEGEDVPTMDDAFDEGGPTSGLNLALPEEEEGLGGEATESAEDDLETEADEPEIYSDEGEPGE